MTARAAVLLDYDSGDDLRRWGIAAAVVVAAHASLIGGYALMPSDEMPGAPSMPAIIMDLESIPAAPASVSDVEPGPQPTDAQEERKGVVEKKPEVVEPLPKQDQPSNVTFLAEQPKPEQKPEERPRPRITAMAPPSSDARPAPTPQAARAGSDARSLAHWRDRVVTRLQNAKRYPTGAGGAQGEAMIRFSLSRDGRVLSRSLVRSSGNSALDEEALAMVNRAAPFPPFPPSISGPSVVLPVPVRFSVR